MGIIIYLVEYRMPVQQISYAITIVGIKDAIKFTACSYSVPSYYGPVQWLPQ